MGKAYHVEHEGKVYNLCCKMCAKSFKENPEKYIEKINKELEEAGHKKDEHGSHKGRKSGHDHDGHDH
ncbi:MAG: TRASH domain-containing protein [Candidatus Omnitrophica bacterium]|nr:TRASH domain-containing protein [Candidatus Omnitrophota bacterium]